MEIRFLGPGDDALLARVSDEVFDHAPRPDATAEFLSDPRHHLVVAIEAGQVIGFASGVHYVHPDKAPELWIAEVGVVPGQRRRGVAKSLMEALLDHGRVLGCVQAWVLTERDNHAARALYAGLEADEADEPVALYAWRLDGADHTPQIPEPGSHEE